VYFREARVAEEASPRAVLKHTYIMCPLAKSPTVLKHPSVLWQHARNKTVEPLRGVNMQPLVKPNMAVVIKRSLAISGGGLKRLWHVDDIAIVDGTEFVELTNRDKGFVSFVYGDTKTDSRCSAVLCQLRALRTEATLKATEPAAEAPALFDDAPNPGLRHLKKQRRNGKDAEERGDLPKTVSITVPNTDVAITVRTALDRSNNIWVEATPATLTAIRESIQKAVFVDDELPEVQTSKNVFWRSDRRCFVAKNMSGKLKSFRPDGSDPDSLNDAAAKASEWATSTSE
jgi:hypothetical protein